MKSLAPTPIVQLRAERPATQSPTPRPPPATAKVPRPRAARMRRSGSLAQTPRSAGTLRKRATARKPEAPPRKPEALAGRAQEPAGKVEVLGKAARQAPAL